MSTEKRYKYIPIPHRPHSYFEINELMNAIARDTDITPYLYMVNETVDNDMSALIFIAKFKSSSKNAEKNVRLLIEAGAKFYKPKYEDDPITLASRRKSNILKILIANYSYQDYPDAYERALCKAAESCCPFAEETCKLLLEACNENVDLKNIFEAVMINNSHVSIKLLKLFASKCNNTEYYKAAMTEAMDYHMVYNGKRSRLQQKLLYCSKFIDMVNDEYINQDLLMAVFICGYFKLFLRLLKMGTKFDLDELLLCKFDENEFKKFKLDKSTIVETIHNPVRFADRIIRVETTYIVSFQDMYNFLKEHIV